MSTTIAPKQTSTAPQQPSTAPQQTPTTLQPTTITLKQTVTQTPPPEHHPQADPPRSKHHPLLPSTMTLLKTLPPSTTIIPNPNEHPSGSALATRSLVSDTPLTNLTASSAAHDFSAPTQDDDDNDDDNDDDDDTNDPGTETPTVNNSGLKTPVPLPAVPPPTTTPSFPPPNAIEYHTHGLSTPHSRQAIATRKREQTKQLLASLDEHPTGSNPLGIVGAGGRGQARGYSSTSGGVF